MSDTHKFVFDSFQDDPSPEIIPLPTEIPEDTREQAFNEGYEKGRQVGYEQGCVYGQLHVSEASHTRVEEIIKKIETSFERILKQDHSISEQIPAQIIKLTEFIFSTLFPFSYQAHGLDEVMSHVRYALNHIIEKHPVTIQVSHAYFDDVVTHLESLQKLYKGGEISVESSPNLAYGDCVVHWEGGGFFWDQSRILEKVESLLSASLHNHIEVTL